MKPQQIEMGMNVTGTGMSPIHSKEMIAGAELGPIEPGSAEAADAVRREYIAGAEPVGTVPLPATVKGAVETAVEMFQGKEPAVFIDKLGERLAFERTSVRFYEALLTKFEVTGSWEGGPTREELQAIRNQELAHFELVRGAMEEIGADPTTMTPAADLAGVTAMGVAQVIGDPRTTLAESVQAIFTAELTDHASWALLVELAQAMGKDEMAAQFDRALMHEGQHVARVRAWLVSHASPEPRREQGVKAAA
jgi:rubrerythrin